jgi:MFS family permease
MTGCATAAEASDRMGRRAALVVTIGLMAAAIGFTGLIPNYQSIGVWAPIALLLCRLLQGFSTGGEWGGAAAFLVEYSPPGKRGLIGSMQQFSTQIGSLSGLLSAALLASALSQDDFYGWGWRIPFVIGFVLGPIGYYLRRKVAGLRHVADLGKRHHDPVVADQTRLKLAGGEVRRPIEVNLHLSSRWDRLSRNEATLGSCHGQGSSKAAILVRVRPLIMCRADVHSENLAATDVEHSTTETGNTLILHPVERAHTL